MKRFIGSRKRGIILVFCFYILAGIGLILSVSVFKRDTWLPYVLGIFLTGIIGYSVFLLNKQVERKGVRLSSRLTTLYDFFIPLTIIDALFADILVLVLGLNSPRASGVLIFLIFVGIMALGVVYLLKLCRLKTLYVFENDLYVSNFFWEESYPIAQIKKLKRWMITNYRLKIEYEGKCYNYLIMPSIREEIARGIGLIEKTEMERFIEKYNLVSKRKKRCFQIFLIKNLRIYK